MKKILFTLLFICSASVATAQIFNFGIKGGLNYNSNGELNSISTITNPIDSDSGSGYHVGAFAEIKLPLWLYLRPELVYTHTESSYSFNNAETALTLDRIDAPLLVGFRVLKIGRIFLGPSFHYNVDLNLENAKASSYDDFTVGAQFGLGLNFGRFGADVRWETGLSETQAIFMGDLINESITVDTRQQQFIFSVYYKFLKKNSL